MEHLFEWPTGTSAGHISSGSSRSKSRIEGPCSTICHRTAISFALGRPQTSLHRRVSSPNLAGPSNGLVKLRNGSAQQCCQQAGPARRQRVDRRGRFVLLRLSFSLFFAIARLVAYAFAVVLLFVISQGQLTAALRISRFQVGRRERRGLRVPNLDV